MILSGAAWAQISSKGVPGADRFYTSEHASDSTIILDYDPDEGDAIIMNGDAIDAEDVQMRYGGYIVDHLGNLEPSDLTIGVTRRKRDISPAVYVPKCN